MNILAVDTSTGVCSVAILDDEKIIAELNEFETSRQAESLVPMFEKALSDANLNYNDMQLLAVTVGPGSFTGVRIGMAAIKGIAISLGIKTVGVSTLAALAWQGRNISAGKKILSVINAMRNEFYVQIFETANSFKFEEITEAKLINTAELPELCKNDSFVIASNCPEIISVALPQNHNHIITEKILPRASDVGQFAKYKYDAGNADFELKPLYIRKPDAKLPSN